MLLPYLVFVIHDGCIFMLNIINHKHLFQYMQKINNKIIYKLQVLIPVRPGILREVLLRA